MDFPPLRAMRKAIKWRIAIVGLPGFVVRKSRCHVSMNKVTTISCRTFGGKRRKVVVGVSQFHWQLGSAGARTHGQLCFGLLRSKM